MESLIDLQRLTGEYLWDLGINIIVALVILVIGRLSTNAISGLTRRLLQRSGLEEILVNFSATVTNALSLWSSSLRPSIGSASIQHR